MTNGTNSTMSTTAFTNTSQTGSIASQETLTTAAGSKTTSVPVGQLTSSSETQSTFKAVPSSSQLPEKSVSLTESTMKEEQHPVTPEIQHTITLTTVRQSSTSYSPKAVTTGHKDSTTSPNNIQTGTGSTSMKPVTSQPSSVITNTPILGSSVAATPKSNNSSTDQSVSGQSPTSFTSTPSKSEMEEEQFLTTPGNHGILKETTTEHSVVSTTTSVIHKKMSTGENTKASPESRGTSTAKTELPTLNHDGTLTTITKSSTVASSTAFSSMTSATPTRSAPRESIACSTVMMPEVNDGASGYISSPGYGNAEEYPPNSNCQWKITADEKKACICYLMRLNTFRI